MIDNFTMSPTDIFNNPFDDVNANNIEPARILSLWCTPFRDNSATAVTENSFRTQKLPIIIQGSRGTGKTTILKYYSYPLLKERAKNRKDSSILKQIQEEKSVGFYFRCDDSFINTFESIFKNQSKEKWLAFFEHYLELQFCSQLISVVFDITNEMQDIAFENDFIKNFQQITNLSELKSCSSITEIRDFVFSEISYINKFKNESIFTDVKFNPSVLLGLYSLSYDLILTIDSLIDNMQKVVYLILVDEFENMTDEIQKFFNTKIKFSHERISLRIGRRSEGVITTATINETEYLRANNDYFLIEINKGMQPDAQKEYFLEVCKKRLDLSAELYGLSIIDIIGEKEDLDNECKNLCKHRDDHLHAVLSERPELKTDLKLRENIIQIIKNPDNPIAETLNALWVIRGKEEAIVSARKAQKAMNDYFEKNNSSNDCKKYKNDYTNKYRYSITVLLASIYKKKKMYYGFNAIVLLADGNTRAFLNICRSIISDALFYEKSSFLKTKTISPDSQNRAICEYSKEEFDSICSIVKHGNNIRNLILNIGNVFAEYHKDKKVRYPETTQFSFNKLDLEEHEKLVLDVAESWSIIQKRENAQRITAGINRKGDLYYINRAFSPLFGISYRIRGGVNVTYTPSEIKEMMTSLCMVNKLDPQKPKTTKNNSFTSEQLTLFDTEVVYDE